MSEKAPSNSTALPSELRISKKWDESIECLIVNTGICVAVAGLSSVVLFRGRSPRLAFTAFGAGIGVGTAWKTAILEFEKEKGNK